MINGAKFLENVLFVNRATRTMFHLSTSFAVITVKKYFMFEKNVINVLSGSMPSYRTLIILKIDLGGYTRSYCHRLDENR